MLTYRVLSIVPPFVKREVGVLGVAESRVGEILGSALEGLLPKSIFEVFAVIFKI
jgi:hypothetical protein